MDLEAEYCNKLSTISVKYHMENWWLSSKWVWSAQPIYGFAIHEFTYHLKLTPTNICIWSFSLSSLPFFFPFCCLTLSNITCNTNMFIIPRLSWSMVIRGYIGIFFHRDIRYSHGFIIQIFQLLFVSSCYWIVGRYGYGRSVAFTLFPFLRVTLCVQSLTRFLHSLFTLFRAYLNFFSGSSFSFSSAIPSEENRLYDSSTAWKIEHEVLYPFFPFFCFWICVSMNAWLKACWFPLSLLTFVIANSGEPFVNVIGECCELQLLHKLLLWNS